MENTTERVCPACGEKLPDDSLFCAKCGTRVDGEAQNAGQITKPAHFFSKNKKDSGSRCSCGYCGTACYIWD